MNTAPHPFTLRQLQYAATLGETLSFRRAAERCHVSQPSLSAQLAQLEGTSEVDDALEALKAKMAGKRQLTEGDDS